MHIPKVSVVMPVYNTARYLSQAVESVLTQTFTGFEFIIIDDGSTDETSNILDNYTDARIRRLRNMQNMGIVHSLNRGLDEARGEYIARMDADDICLSERFEKQVRYLDDHPNIGCVGADVLLIDVEGRFLNNGEPVNGQVGPVDYIRWKLLWGNPLHHSTVMLRRALLTENDLHYYIDFEGTEDYDLWTKLSQHTHLVQMEDVLLYYRIVPTGIIGNRTNEQLGAYLRVMQREINAFGVKNAGVETLFALLTHCSNVPLDFKAASVLVQNLYHIFMKRYTPTEVASHRIRDDTLTLLAIITYHALRHRSAATMYSLVSWLRLSSFRHYFMLLSVLFRAPKKNYLDY